MKYIIIAAILVLLSAGVSGARTILMTPAALDLESESQSAPDFTLSGLDSRSVSLSDYKDKNEVILFFWTVQCRFCRSELIEFNRIYKTIEAEGIRLISINVGENRSRVERYLANLGVEFPVYMDTDTRVASLYSIPGVPTFVFVNKQGDLISRSHSFPRNYKDKFLER